MEMRHFIRWAETKIRELVNYVYKIFTNLINSNLGANTTDVKTITFTFSNAVVSPTITAQLVALGYTISII